MRILGSWRDHQSTKNLSVRAQLGATFCLRQRMLHFLQNLVYYMTLEVIKPADHLMQQGLRAASDMDEVSLCVFDASLANVLFVCLLFW